MKLTTKFLIAVFLGLLSFSVKAQETIPDSLGKLIPVNGQFFVTIHRGDTAIWHFKGYPYGYERLSKTKDLAAAMAGIKTINGNSLLGGGDLVISGVSSGAAGGDLSGTYPNPIINLINGITRNYYDPTSSIQTQLNSKQPTLVSGSNIKTINGTSVLGSGDIVISGGGIDTATSNGVKNRTGANNELNLLSNRITTNTSSINTVNQSINDVAGVPALTGYNSNVAVAYATIRIYPSATKAFRLRRSSDNVTQDFYFDANGNVSQDDINKFLDGYRGYLAIWYDQSPNGINAVQATNSQQPYVVIENGIVKVRFESLYSTNLGQALTYTLSNGIDVSNTTVFCAYSSYTANALDQVYPTPNFYTRYLISSANAKLDLFLDGNNAAHPSSLTLNAANTASLFAWQHANYFSINSNGTAAKVRSNYSAPVSLTALPSYTETQFKIGNKFAANGQPFAGDIYAYVQYSASQADAVIDTLASRLKIPYSLVSPADNNINVCVSGDSESNGNQSTNNQNWVKQLNNLVKTPVINFATISNTFTIQNSNNYNVSIDQAIQPGHTNVLFVWMGTNDRSGANAAPLTDAQVYNAMVSWTQARKAAGWNKVVVLTAMDRGSVGTFSSMNALIKANTTDFDAVLDVASDSRLVWMTGYGGSTTTLSQPDYAYFAKDNVHLTNTGYKVISSYADNYIESIASTNTQLATLGRRVKALESYISQLQSLSILNRNAQQHGVAGMDSLYTHHIYGSQKPLDTIKIDANKVSNLSNAGVVDINSTGAGHVIFGPPNIGYSAAAYTFGYGSAPSFSNLTIAYNNPAKTNTILQFFNDATTTGITNSNITAYSNSNTLTMSLYTLYDLKLESNQGNVYMQTLGVPGLGVHASSVGATYLPLAGTYGYAKTSTSFLNLSNSVADAKGSALKFMPGVPQQTVLELGAVNFDATGSWLYLSHLLNGTLTNDKFQFVSNHTIFTPTSGSTVTLVNNQRNIINPSGSLAALTVALPASPANNDVVYIKFTNAITSLTYSGGAVVGGVSSPSAGGLITLTYDSATTSWY